MGANIPEARRGSRGWLGEGSEAHGRRRSHPESIGGKFLLSVAVADLFGLIIDNVRLAPVR